MPPPQRKLDGRGPGVNARRAPPVAPAGGPRRWPPLVAPAILPRYVDAVTAIPPAIAAPWELHVLAHTHWDREWYHAAERFRQRLVPLLDALLASPATHAPFLLDGQAITVRDYLAVRPEAAPRLAHALRSGAVEAGPWFVLADALIPGGEALIRNLEAGRRELARHGARAPMVAYCPDSFGHPAALPSLAAGFGLPVAVVWRGLGGAGHPAATVVRWRAPDGATVLAWHLPRDGYEIGRALPHDAAEARARWVALRDGLAPRHPDGPWLLLNGADHHAQQPALNEAVAALRAAAHGEATVRRGTLQGFADALQEHARGRELPLVHGELRDSYAYTWTLGGTLATRAHQKRRNARLERLLLRDVEPWGVLAWWHAPAWAHRTAPDGRLTLRQWPALLAAAWESLLATHPHDTLCGCSTDTVARAMEARQEATAAQGVGLRQAALALALGHDAAAARPHAPPAWAPVLLRNRAARARHGVALVELVETLGDAPVGPGSAHAPAPPGGKSTILPLPPGRCLQPAGSRLAYARRESPQHYPDNDLVRVHRWLAWVPPVPPFGVRLLDARVADGEDTPPLPEPVWVERGVAAGGGAPGLRLGNGLVTVEVRDGRVSVRADGDHPRLLPDALRLEAQDDAGDSYTPSPRGAPRRLMLVKARLGDRGPLRGALHLSWRLAGGDADLVPSAVASQAGAPPTRRRQGPVLVVTELALVAGSPLLQCRVVGRNRRRHHRLRLLWQTDVVEGRVVADAALGPVERKPPQPPPETRERPPDGMPLHRWVSTAADTHGAALLSDGLAEAVVAPGQLGVTLLRAIGELSRSDLPERPGHAGWPAAIPGAQAQGRFAARLALWLHGPHTPGIWQELGRHADDLLLPLTGTAWRDPLPAGWGDGHGRSGPALEGDGLEASAVTLTEDGAGVLLRAVNLTEATASGAWRLPDVGGPYWATPCRLDGTPTGHAQPVGQGGWPLTVPPRATVTIRVDRTPHG